MESNIHPSICICPRDRKWFFSFADVIVSSTAGTDTHNRIKIQLSKKLIDRVSYNFIDQKKNLCHPSLVSKQLACPFSFSFLMIERFDVLIFLSGGGGGIVSFWNGEELDVNVNNRRTV
jgi:hypothetical protein